LRAQTLLPPYVVVSQSGGKTQQEIWTPDTYFRNEKLGKLHDISKPNLVIRIYGDGRIMLSARLNTLLLHANLCKLEQYYSDPLVSDGLVPVSRRRTTLSNEHDQLCIYIETCPVSEMRF
jgi:hypothetical protein